MDRVNGILNNEKYKNLVSTIEMYEAERKFCKHDLNHFMDVARIAYILVLEKNIDIDKEIVYASALLHDIGRGAQYRYGLSHNEAGLSLAEEILSETGFNSKEKTIVLDAIKHHRDENNTTLNTFSGIFSKSDKLSRGCYNCKATENCNWSCEKRNYIISY